MDYDILYMIILTVGTYGQGIIWMILIFLNPYILSIYIDGPLWC